MIPILLVVIVLGVWAGVVFNSFVRQRNRVMNAWADIDVQLKKRYDLVPNLVETVRGYKEYESSVLERVTEARASVGKAAGGENLTARENAENTLASAVRTLFMVAENYPQLKASETFKKLQDELSAIENDIESARRYYNAAVRELNNTITVFPANILAGPFGFSKAEFFGAEKNEREAVKVSV